MKSFVKLALAGISGVVLLKLFASIVIPLLGMALGLVALALKLAVLVAVAFFLYSLLRKREDEDLRDGEIVVETEEAARPDESGDGGSGHEGS